MMANTVRNTSRLVEVVVPGATSFYSNVPVEDWTTTWIEPHRLAFLIELLDSKTTNHLVHCSGDVDHWSRFHNRPASVDFDEILTHDERDWRGSSKGL